MGPAHRPQPSAVSDSDDVADLTAVESLPILLVDDQPENLRTLEAVLEPLGYPLVTTGSGHGALRLLLERDFAMILLDVRMPGLDGLETAQLIKERARTRDIPIVFLTAARDEVSDIARGYGVGAVDYVLKPFDPELLRSKVAVFAELEASRRALKRSEASAQRRVRGGADRQDGARRRRPDHPLQPARSPTSSGRDPDELIGMAVVDLCEPEDRPALAATFEEVRRAARGRPAPERPSVDLRLRVELGRGDVGRDDRLARSRPPSSRSRCCSPSGST